MAQITFKGNPIETVGDLPKAGTPAKDFSLVSQGLEEKKLANYGTQYKVLNIFPSLDTGTCATSVRTFHQTITNDPKVVVLNISKDLPFAMGRFCKEEKMENIEMLSAFRSTFAEDYGLTFKTGILQGLCSRAIVVLDAQNKVVHSEQVAETTEEPDYKAVLRVLKSG